MEEVSHLIIKVSSDQAEVAAARLKNLGFNAEKAEKSVDGMSRASGGLAGTIGRLLGPLAGMVTLTAGLTKLVSVSRQFEILRASLKTTIGTVEGANQAFEALQQFAATTPYDLAQTTEAFIKLANLGLTPSERALKAYGDTAAAMGKDLGEFVQAVSRSVSGEFDPLKQFGIQASKEAEGIRFTFRGVSTTVRQSAKDIEEYFIKLGQQKFAGGMEERAKTLDGALSNLADTWDSLFDTIGRAGSADLIQKVIRGATEALQELIDMIASGELQGYIEAIGSKFTSIFGGMAADLEATNMIVTAFFKDLGFQGESVFKSLWEAFKNIPENVTAVVRGIGTAIGAGWEGLQTIDRGIRRFFSDSFSYVVRIAKITGDAIWSALNPTDLKKTGVTEFAKRLAEATKEYAVTTAANLGGVTRELEGVWDSFGDGITVIMNERDAAVSSFSDQITAAKKLRAEYDALQKSKSESAKSTDRLGGLTPGASSKRSISSEERGRFDALRESLQLEETSIAESYKKRLALIRDNTEDNNDLRVQLERELNMKVGEEYEKAFQSRKSKVMALEEDLRKAVAEGRFSDADALSIQLKSEEQRIADSYAARKEQILADTQTTEDEKLMLLTALETKYTEQQRQFEAARHKATMTQVGDFFGNISQMASAFGKKGSKIAKAAAIAQTTIKTYESATSAYAALAGIPYVGPALGAAAAGAAIAAGMANVAAIKSQDYAGAYAMGGMIPAGKVGLVGETGQPELVRGPAVVTGVRDTANILGRSGGNGASNISVVINNEAGGQMTADVTQRQEGDAQLVEITVRRAKAELTNEVNRGGSPFTTAFERTYGMKRGAAA
jgi:phage-related protein